VFLSIVISSALSDTGLELVFSSGTLSYIAVRHIGQVSSFNEHLKQNPLKNIKIYKTLLLHSDILLQLILDNVGQRLEF